MIEVAAEYTAIYLNNEEYGNRTILLPQLEYPLGYALLPITGWLKY